MGDQERFRAMGRDDSVSPEMEPTTEIEQAGTRLLGDRRRMLTVLAAFLLLIVGIYVLLPKVVGLSGSLKRLSDPSWFWIVVAIGFNGFSFLAYAALFRGILGGRDDGDMIYRRLDFSASFKITMAGLRRPRSSRPRAPAGWPSPTGRSARPEWSAGARPAGWWRSSCCSTPCTRSRSSFSASC